MLGAVKRLIPKPVKYFLRLLINKMIAPLRKKLLAKKMRLKHHQLLHDLKGKEKIKVIFLELFKGMWKLDPVFKKMLNDPYFEPIILVCPCVSYGEDAMWKGIEETYCFFKNKNYPIISAYNEIEKKWIKLAELNPDIVFFSIPHNMTRKEYYEDVYLNYLSCYVPYHHEVGSYNGNISQYDEFFHNAQWKIFVSHKCSQDIYKKISHAGGKNVIVTGYPMMEEFFRKNKDKNTKNWKNTDNRLRVIWAPHHTIGVDYLPYSNFLEYAESFRRLAEKYKDCIFWSFKPHPELRLKLYAHIDWGKEKTDSYYQYWDEQEFSQLDLGEYIDLFLSSDAMIHDCGSFLAEYLYLRKPVLYMLNKNNGENYYNHFGLNALYSCRISRNFSDVEKFIWSLISIKEFSITKTHFDFYKLELLPYFDGKKPSEIILSKIKESLSNDT